MILMCCLSVVANLQRSLLHCKPTRMKFVTFGVVDGAALAAADWPAESATSICIASGLGLRALDGGRAGGGPMSMGGFF